jgi:hypothetical protein
VRTALGEWSEFGSCNVIKMQGIGLMWELECED